MTSERRNQRIKAGLCVGLYNCKNPPRKGKTLCQRCADAHTESQFRYRKGRVVAGLCYRGGCPNKCGDDDRYCPDHSRKQREYQQAWVKEHRLRMRQHSKKFYEHRKELGRCRYCPKELYTQTCCEEHAAIVRARSEAWRRRQGVKPTTRAHCSRCGTLGHTYLSCPRREIGVDVVQYATARRSVDL